MVTYFASEDPCGKVACITGGARGIGKAIVGTLLAHGWHVIAPSYGECNLLEYDSVAAYAVHLAADISRLDALILNAHAWQSAPLVTQTPEDFDTQMAYVRQHWVLMTSLLQQISLECVVAVSSMRGLIGGVDCGLYSMAKAALIAMMLGFARDYRGTRFHVICPGYTNTDMGIAVKESGGVSNPDAVPQPPECVAQTIYAHCLVGTANGLVLRVNNRVVDTMRWREDV